MTSECLTIRFGEALRLVGVSRNTFYRLLAEGRVPGARKLGNTWRIHRATFLAWLAGDWTPRTPPSPPPVEEPQTPDPVSSAAATIDRTAARSQRSLTVVPPPVQDPLGYLGPDPERPRARNVSPLAIGTEPARDYRFRLPSSVAGHLAQVAQAESSTLTNVVATAIERECQRSRRSREATALAPERVRRRITSEATRTYHFRLPDDLSERLAHLAATYHCSRTFVVCAAIEREWQRNRRNRRRA